MENKLTKRTLTPGARLWVKVHQMRTNLTPCRQRINSSPSVKTLAQQHLVDYDEKHATNCTLQIIVSGHEIYARHDDSMPC
jgi:hypothetical protein